MAQRRGQRCLNHHPLAARRLCKSDAGGVQEIAFEQRQHCLTGAHLLWRPVQTIADNRMAQRRKMHADLMGAAGMQIDFDQRKTFGTREHAPIGPRVASTGERSLAPRGHPRTPARIARNGQFDSPGIAFEPPVHQRDVAFLDFSGAELIGKFLMRRIIPRHD
jgi:hypothetical protein